MDNLFRIIDDARWKYYRRFNNIILSEALADEILKLPLMVYSAPTQSNHKTRYVNGYLYGVPVIVDKFMPSNRLVLRNNDDVVAIVNLED
jgi:hypothetical protein